MHREMWVPTGAGVNVELDCLAIGVNPPVVDC